MTQVLNDYAFAEKEISEKLITNIDELSSKGFENYITRFKDKPNNERLKLIIDNVLNSKYIQKDDLTIVVVDSK